MIPDTSVDITSSSGNEERSSDDANSYRRYIDGVWSVGERLKNTFPHVKSATSTADVTSSYGDEERSSDDANSYRRYLDGVWSVAEKWRPRFSRDTNVTAKAIIKSAKSLSIIDFAQSRLSENKQDFLLIGGVLYYYKDSKESKKLVRLARHTYNCNTINYLNSLQKKPHSKLSEDISITTSIAETAQTFIKDIEKENKYRSIYKYTMWGLGIAIGVTTVVSIPWVLGFTNEGVAIISLAAKFQSIWFGGYVIAGSLFAILQSVAATTIIGTCLPAMATGVLVIGGVIFYYKDSQELENLQNLNKYFLNSKIPYSPHFSKQAIAKTMLSDFYTNVGVPETVVGCLSPETVDPISHVAISSSFDTISTMYPYTLKTISSSFDTISTMYSLILAIPTTLVNILKTF